MPRTVIIREPSYALTVKSGTELQLKLHGPQGPSGNASAGGGVAILSDTPPPDPTNGIFWYDTEDGILSVWEGTMWVGQDFLPIPPVVLPVLSDVSAIEGDGEVTLSATSDHSGMMYFYVSLSATPEDPADIIAGTGSWLQYDAAVCAAGDPVVLLMAGLTNDVEHFFHAMAVDEDDDQSTISVVSFTPTDGGGVPALAFLDPSSDPYTYLGDYFLAPA